MRIGLIREYYEGKEYLEKLRHRVETMRALSIDPLTRIRTMQDLYQYDFQRFCEEVLFLIIPEYGDAIKPFFLFDYQTKIIDKLEWAEDFGGDVEILIDKPRGMGITWLMAAYYLWKWLFRPNWTVFILSRTEKEVDDGTDAPGNSFFSKLRWLIAHMPKWMLPEGFKPKGEKGTSTDAILKLINPQIGSGIFGSSTNSNAGRSRRYSQVLIDECFAIDRFTEVHRSLSTVARVQVYVSTTKASIEAKKFKDAVEKAGNYISLEWRDHPWKDQEWYEEQLRKAEFDPEIMKEVDKGYVVSEKMQYYPQIKFSRIVKIEYNPQLPIFCGLDFGKNDFTVIIWAQFDGNQINLVECYANNQRIPEWYAPFMNPECELNLEYSYTDYQLAMIRKIKTWQKPKAWFGELSHANKSTADHKSVASVLARHGIRIMYNTYANTHEPRRHATSLLLPRMIFNENSEAVLKLYDAIANSKYVDSSSSKEAAMKPHHTDEIADYRAALENLSVNVGRIFKSQRDDLSEDIKKENFVGNLISYLKN